MDTNGEPGVSRKAKLIRTTKTYTLTQFKIAKFYIVWFQIIIIKKKSDKRSI